MTLGAAVSFLLRGWVGRKDNVYETEMLVSQYMAFHYGRPEILLPYDLELKDSLTFPVQVANQCFEYEQGQSHVSRALDIGCAVGRSSFELAKHYEEVVGIDYSHRFIAEANQMKADGNRAIEITAEGHLSEPMTVEVDPSIDRSRVTFQWGDAGDLNQSLGQFGAVLAANLVDRLPNPRKFLKRCSSLVAPGGVLIISTPYTFLEEFTPKDQWLGGYVDKNGQSVRGVDTLEKELGDSFELLDKKDLPFFIKETARKNQWTVSQMTAWRRKGL